MIEQVIDMVGHPGRYEGLGAFEIWLCENVNEVADETDGDVEYGLWFARCGRFLVTTDSQGFWYVGKYATLEDACTVFAAAAADYSAWAAADDE